MPAQLSGQALQDDRAPWLVDIDAIRKLPEEVDSIVREQAKNNFPGTYPPEI
jgi:hypothetical protein